MLKRIRCDIENCLASCKKVANDRMAYTLWVYLCRSHRNERPKCMEHFVWCSHAMTTMPEHKHIYIEDAHRCKSNRWLIDVTCNVHVYSFHCTISHIISIKCIYFRGSFKFCNALTQNCVNGEPNFVCLPCRSIFVSVLLHNFIINIVVMFTMK